MDTNESTPRFRIGLVGVGAIGRTYCQSVQESELVEMVGVADTCVDAAKAASEVVGCPAFSSAASLVAGTQPDAVVVCTPPNTHEAVCTELLDLGVHVLCEKPLAIGVESAQRMLKAAKLNERTLTMASKFRFVEDVAEAKAILASGILGKVVLFENVFATHVDMGDRWNSDPTISGGGVLIDNGTHSLDIMRFFLGPLAEIQVVEGVRSQHLPVEETVRIFAKTADGILGGIDLSWSIHKHQPAYISIYGTGGTLEVGWQSSRYRRHQDNDWTSFGTGFNKVIAFRRLLDNFAQSIRGEEELLVQPTDALASVAAVEAAYSALKASAWQPVEGIPTQESEAAIGNGQHHKQHV